MSQAISPRRAPKAPPARRPREDGILSVPKLVRLYPEELALIERAAGKLNVTSSRFITEAAVRRAKSLR